MWYDKRTMTVLFYLGVMLTLVGVGLWKLDYAVIGVILVIVGVTSVVIGFWGIGVNNVIEDRFRKRQKKR